MAVNSGFRRGFVKLSETRICALRKGIEINGHVTGGGSHCAAKFGHITKKTVMLRQPDKFQYK
jgi:hypothetical protein